MKKLLPFLCLTLLLASCGGQSPTSSPTPVELSAGEAAQTVLNTKAFSETLEVVDNDIAAALYMIDEELIGDCAAYLSTGATAEECTFLVTTDEKAAQTVIARFQTRVEEQKLALENYQPAEIPKLKEAIHGYCAHKDGFLAYLVVAADAAAAQDAVDTLIS